MRCLTILGSGNSRCDDGRGHASFLLETPAGGKILLDVGATALLRANEHGESLARLDAIVLTHFHGDHTLGLPFVLYEQKTRHRRERSLAVLGPAGTRELAWTLLDVSALGRDLGYPLEFSELEEAETVQLETLSIEASAVTHRPESLGYRVTFPDGRIVAFSGDCRFDDRLIRLVDGADLAVVEVTLPGGPSPRIAHVALDELRSRRAELNVPRLVLTHVNDAIAEEIRDEGLGEPAHDGTRVRF
jgi:ribonuclease BN (tRNA processing enzyme)